MRKIPMPWCECKRGNPAETGAYRIVQCWDDKCLDCDHEVNWSVEKPRTDVVDADIEYSDEFTINYDKRRTYLEDDGWAQDT